MSMMKNQTCCFTGHRDIPIRDRTRLKNKLITEIEKLIEKGVIFYGNGGALGFDTLAALAVLELKEKYPQIKLIMVLPCKEQDKKWREADKKMYASILNKADKIVYTSEHYHNGCMHKRNEHLVNNSDFCISYVTKNTGGSAYTVEYAMRCGTEIIDYARI